MSSATQKICHFLPGKYTCLAYDKENSLLAIGCETGEIAILREKPREIEFLPVSTFSSVEILSFAVGKGLLLTVLKNDSTLYLWNANKKSLEHSVLMQKTFSNEDLFSDDDLPSSAPVVPIITCVTWSEHNYFYVGTDAGTVKILQLQEKVMKTGDIKYELVWGSDFFSFKDPFEGNVMTIQESDKYMYASRNSGVLLVSSKGHCVLWTWSAERPSTCKKVATKDSLISAWWSPKGNITTAQNDGTITVHQMSFTTLFNCNVDDYTTNSTIYKIKPVRIGAAKEEYLIYAVEDTEEGVKQSRRILSLHTRVSGFDDVKSFIKPLPPFGGRIVDFECLATDHGKPTVLTVLTENELMVLEIDDVPIDKYIGVRQSCRYPYLTSPVTYLQHCGLCTEYFMKYVKQVMTGHSIGSQDQAIQSDESMPTGSELIATGHRDGSVRLWLCTSETETSLVSFECGLVVYTADYFDFSKLDDTMKEITLVKVSNSQKYMNVVNKSGRVLLFKFSQQQPSTKPQSQEIFLKSEQNTKEDQSNTRSTPSPTASLPSSYSLLSVSQASPTASLPAAGLTSTQSSTLSKVPLETPPPHFSPCQWQTSRVQLLQHFSCHYQSGRDQPLEPVTVNCVDYYEQMGIWLVGTEKCLIVLDLPQRLLLDVIRSEKKLLKKSGSKTSAVRTPSAVSCCVVCIETISEIQLTQEVPQTSLWVATAGKALGVFTLNYSDADKDILQRTDMGKIVSNKFVDILHCRSSKCGSEDVFVVRVTKKQIKSHVYPGGRTYKSGTNNVIKTGIVSDKDGVPHLITLDSSGILRLLVLPELTLTSHDNRLLQKKMISNSAGKVLFSSGGQHAVWCSERAVHCCYPF